MATLLSACPTSFRAPVSVRAAVSSGSRAPANLVSISSTQLLSRLDALSLRAKNMDIHHTATSPMEEGAASAHREEALYGTHFGECRARLQHWWKEHLEDKAALVQAACRDFSVEEEEQTVHFNHPVELTWMDDRYPKPVFGSRF